jgi:hypothetical protein
MSARLPEPMSLGRYRVLLAVLVLAAVVAFVAMIRSTDTGGPEEATASDVVERFVPNAGDEVLRQAELGVDLAPGYDGTLFVNGVEIPVEDQRRVPEQNQMFFTPGEGKAIERLPAGANCAMALVWKASDGRGTSRDQSLQWCFKAT